MSRKRVKQNFNNSGSENDEGEYPTTLLSTVRAEAWESPSKATKVYKQPLKRRKAGAGGLRTGEPSAQGFSSSAGEADIEWPAADLPFPQGDDVSSGETPAPSLAEFDEEGIRAYQEAVENYTAGFLHVEGTVFVVEGWCPVKRQSTPNHWYHLQYLWIAGNLHTTCTCPRGIEVNSCIHQAFFQSFEAEDLLRDFSPTTNASKDGPKAIIFLRQSIAHSPDFHTLLTVDSLSSSHLKGRAIVSHVGSRPATGTWKCSKDSATTPCFHIKSARKALEIQIEKEGPIANDEESMQTESAVLPVQPFVSLAESGSISYLPVLPPLSAMLKTDEILYPRPYPPRDAAISPLKLDARSSCKCSAASRHFYDPQKPTVYHRCRIYTITSVLISSIELQRCEASKPRVRYIGPDLRESGIFNYNNTTLVSHELLDEYTMAFVGSETSFTAFVSLVAHRYAMTGAAFMGEDLFLSVWFAYVSIQALENDMVCRLCGPSPSTSIFDGITLAFGRKHSTGTLRPPTTITAESVKRTKIKNRPRLQLITDEKLRKQIRRALEVPDLEPMSSANETGSGDESSVQDLAQQRIRQAQQAKEYFELVDTVHIGLSEICPALGTLFHSSYSAVVLLQPSSTSGVYRSFFRQVAAEESVLQLVNGSSLKHLTLFLENTQDISRLVTIPAIYNLVRKDGITAGILSVLRWIEARAQCVLDTLTVERPLDAVVPLRQERIDEKDDWITTGCHYSLPQRRHRPEYPNLKTDKKKEKSMPRGDMCGKYYSTYVERGLTGGIMVAWCTHSICYGFHCIPEAEGRNDVFSALVTRWETAPKVIIYDFACALGPYCMLREPEFFKDTLFVIDHFHAAGHTKCSPAAMLSQYANVDPRLSHLNSSAGESGNGALKRIRKSVSYMKQIRAIIYTKVFLSVWNRIRLRRMGG